MMFTAQLKALSVINDTTDPLYPDDELLPSGQRYFYHNQPQ